MLLTPSHLHYSYTAVVPSGVCYNIVAYFCQLSDWLIPLVPLVNVYG